MSQSSIRAAFCICAAAAVFAAACSSKSSSVTPVPAAKKLHRLSLPVRNWATIGGRVSGNPLNRFKLNATGTCTGRFDMYYNPPGTLTAIDPPSATPYPGQYAQTTGVMASPQPCNTVTAASYVTLSWSALSQQTLSGTVDVVYPDGTFDLRHGGTVNRIILNNYYTNLDLPVVGQSATVTGIGIAGPNHFLHATSASVITPPARSFAKVHAYIGYNTGGCEGWDPGLSFAQSSVWEIQSCDTSTTAATDCPPGGNCQPMYYFDPHIVRCQLRVENLWNAQASANEVEYLHTAVPGTSTNRVYQRTANCNGVSVNPNPGDLTYNVPWWKSNVVAGHASNARFMEDDTFIGRPCNYDGTGCTAEFASLSAWRQALGLEIANYAPYGMVSNALGPGGGNYSSNNTSTVSREGIVNWAVGFIPDFCSQAGGNLKALVSEKSIGNSTSANVLVLTPGNWQIYINNASIIFNDPACAGVDFEDLELTAIPPISENFEIQKLTKAVQMLVTPTDGSDRVVAWHYTIDRGNPPTQFAVFPQDQVVFKAPAMPFGEWHWGGAGNGTGCGSGSTGGAADLIAPGTCGIGTDVNHFPVPIWIREGACYVSGALIGPCAVVVNPSNAPQTYQASWFVRNDIMAYHTRLTWSGGPIPAACAPGAACTGTLFQPATSFNGTSDSIAANDADILFP